MRDREVDDRRPDAGEEHPGAELRAVGDRTGDQRDGDDREDRLEADEGHGGKAPASLVGVRAIRPVEAEELAGVAEQSGADVVAEGHRVAVEHPRTLISASAPKLIIIMFSTLFARTMPP